MFTNEQKARKQEIIYILSQGSIDTDLIQELTELNAIEKQAEIEREGEIVETIKAVKELGITFTEIQKEVNFPASEIINYLTVNGFMKGRLMGNRSPNKAHSGIHLFNIRQPNSIGAPTKVYSENGKIIFPKWGDRMNWLKTQNDVYSTLKDMQMNTDEARTLLTSDEGEAELQRFVTWVENGGYIPLPSSTPTNTNQAADPFKPKKPTK